MTSQRSEKMVTQSGWAASQRSPGTGPILVLQSPIPVPMPSTFLLSEGAVAAPWKAPAQSLCPPLQPRLSTLP